MTVTLAHVRTLAQQLRGHHANLRAALSRISRIPADADAQLSELLTDRVFARLGKDHHERTRQDIASELRAVRVPAASVALHRARSSALALALLVSELREGMSRPPDAVASFLARTCGERVNLSDSTELLLYVLDEQRRARFAQELADAPPSVVRARYAEALGSDSDEAGSLVRFVDGRRSGWADGAALPDSEVAEAVQLRHLMAEARAARLPLELDEAAAAVDEAHRLVAKATARDLYDLRPSDPQRDIVAAGHFEQESEAWAAEAATVPGEAQS